MASPLGGPVIYLRAREDCSTGRQPSGLGSLLMAGLTFCHAGMFVALAGQWWSNDMHSCALLPLWVSLFLAFDGHSWLTRLKELRDRISRLQKEPPFVILQTLLSKVPFQPVGVGWFYALQFNGVPMRNPRLKRGPGDVRGGTLGDIEGMARCENKREEIFLRRLTNGDHCAVAIINDRIVGYEWFCDKPFHLEERYLHRVNIPSDAIYAYDAYILHEYRLRGLWLKFKEYLADLMQKLGRNKIITMIEYGNRLSMNTHLRFGFKPYRSVLVIKFFGKKIFIERSI